MPKTSSNTILLTIFVTLRPLTQFNPKIRATDLKQVQKYQHLKFETFILKFALSHILKLFTEVKIWYWKTLIFCLERFLRKIFLRKVLFSQTMTVLTFWIVSTKIKSRIKILQKVFEKIFLIITHTSSLTILVIWRLLTQFHRKLEGLNCKEVLKFVLFGNSFSNFSLVCNFGI